MLTGTAVYVICMDLCKSTEKSLALSTLQNDLFNYHVVEHLRENLSKLGLEEILSKCTNDRKMVTKCTGDGWLVMSDEVDNTFILCALAVIVSRFFREDMSIRTNIPEAYIPEVRLGIGSGRDIWVKMPDGRNDWMGDSARRATRLLQICKRGEILVSESFREKVIREFRFSRVDVDKRLDELELEKKDIKWEEDLVVSTLQDISPNYLSPTFSANE